MRPFGVILILLLSSLCLASQRHKTQTSPGQPVQNLADYPIEFSGILDFVYFLTDQNQMFERLLSTIVTEPPDEIPEKVPSYIAQGVVNTGIGFSEEGYRQLLIRQDAERSALKPIMESLQASGQCTVKPIGRHRVQHRQNDHGGCEHMARKILESRQQTQESVKPSPH